MDGEGSDSSLLDLRSTEIGWILGRALRRLREAEGFSQEGLARRLEVSRETVRRIEFGEGTTTATIDRVLDVLDYTAADLLAACRPEDAASRVYLHAQAPPSRFHWPRRRPRDVSPRRVMPRSVP